MKLLDDPIATMQFLLSQVMFTCPKDTRNLVNTTGYEITQNGARVYIGGVNAPYMKYTNEPWKRGRNPNEKWFDRTVENAINIASNDIRINYIKGG